MAEFLVSGSKRETDKIYELNELAREEVKSK